MSRNCLARQKSRRKKTSVDTTRHDKRRAQDKQLRRLPKSSGVQLLATGLFPRSFPRRILILPPRPPIFVGSLSVPRPLHLCCSKLFRLLNLLSFHQPNPPRSFSRHSPFRWTSRHHGCPSPLLPKLRLSQLSFVVNNPLHSAWTPAVRRFAVLLTLPCQPFVYYPIEASPLVTAPGLCFPLPLPLPLQRVRSCRPSPARRFDPRLPVLQGGC